MSFTALWPGAIQIISTDLIQMRFGITRNIYFTEDFSPIIFTNLTEMISDFLYNILTRCKTTYRYYIQKIKSMNIMMVPTYSGLIFLVYKLIVGDDIVMNLKHLFQHVPLVTIATSVTLTVCHVPLSPQQNRLAVSPLTTVCV